MSQDLFNAQRLQLPDRINNLNSNVIIRKTNAKVNTSDKNIIEYSLKDSDTSYKLTEGQIKKKLANFTKKKVCSNKEAESIINTILADSLGF